MGVRPTPHADIFKGLKNQHACEANAYECRQTRLRAGGDIQAAADDHGKQQDDGHTADKPQLLTGHGKDEIGMLGRQTARLRLRSFEKSLPEQLARTQGDF